MTKKAILHIGSGKTGSTTLQKVLYKNKATNDSQLYYPALLEHTNNQIFRFPFCDISDTPRNIFLKYDGNPESYESYQNSILKNFRDVCSEHESVLISSEFLFLSSKEEVARIKIFLNSLGFDEIHIILYIRNPADYYLSAAQQAIKNSHRIPSPSRFRYDILGAIESWKNIDAKSFNVREFERSKLIEGDIVADFKQLLGELGFDLELKGNEVTNETMSVEASILMHEAQVLLEKQKLNNTRLAEYLKQIRAFSNKPGSKVGTKPKLKSSVKSSILNKYKDDIEKLKNSFSIFQDLHIESCKNELKENVYTFDEIVENFSLDVYLKMKNIL